MDTVMTILYVLLLAWSLISAIIYLGRRSRSRSTYKETLKDATPTRQLGASEREAIAKAFKKTSPLDDNVYSLHGPASRHGLQGNHGNEWHLLVAGVEICPFPNWLLLSRDDNAVEVVKPRRGKVAIPVKFNGVTLVQAIEAREDDEAMESRLEAGRAGPIEDTPSPGDITPDEAPQTARITGRREESIREASLRRISGGNNAGMATWFGIGLLGTLLCTLLPGAFQVIALVFALLAVWSGWQLLRYWQTPRSEEPHKIRSLYGPLSLRFVQAGSDKDPMLRHELCIGEVAVHYPKHWLAAIGDKIDGMHKVDIDLNHQVVRHDRLSLYDELSKFPKPRWGRYLILLLFCLPTTLVAWNMLSPLPDATRQLLHHLNGQTRHLAPESAQAFVDQQPQPGDWVRVHGKAQCLQRPGEAASNAIHALHDGGNLTCNMLGWSDIQAPLNNTPVPKTIENLAGMAEQVRPDRSSRRERRLRRAMATLDPDHARRMRALENLLRSKRFTHFNQRVRDVAALCPDDAYGCEKLKRAMSILAHHDHDWKQTLEQARADKLPETIRVGYEDAKLLSKLLDRALAPRMFDAVVEAHPATVILRLESTGFTPRHGSSGSTAGLPPWVRDVHTLAATPFDISGVVQAVSSNDGREVYTLTPRDDPMSPFKRLAPWGIGLMALLLVLYNAFHLWRASREYKQRAANLTQYVQRNL